LPISTFLLEFALPKAQHANSDPVPHPVTALAAECYWTRKHPLTSSDSKGEDSRRPTPPAPEELARRLLAAEAGEKTRPEELAAAGERAYLRLRERLSVLLGPTGFDALWARAVHLAQRKFRSDDTTAAEESVPMHGYALHAAVRGRASVVGQHNLVVAFASFITLLFTFIGEELSLRFIRQIWPDLPPDATDPRADGATQ
jgi:hypothetical protein